MAIVKTSNTHQTYLLVAEQIPDFVREDHPVFVEFIEKYYEFLAQANSTILTSDKESYYYGADYAAKVLPDIHDIDTTDLELFIDSFKKQYAPRFPEQLSSSVNTRTFYKNLIDFYRARGTEDSFKFLFRLLFNDDNIELYYPKKDMLIASGGNFSASVDMLVAYTDGINNLKGQQIVGADSGASAIVHRVVVMPTEPVLGFKSGRTEQPYKPDSSPETGIRGLQLNHVFGMGSNREKMSQKVFLALAPSTMVGNFNIHETVYTSNTLAGVTNTVVLPSVVETVFHEDFSSYKNANNLISFDDNTPSRRETQWAPWNPGSKFMSAGTIGPSKSNTGFWHNTSGRGEIKILKEYSLGQVRGATGINKQVLQIGSNPPDEPNADDVDVRNLVFTKNIPFNADKLYRFSIRARDLQGGRTAEWAAENDPTAASLVGVNQFQVGLVTMTANSQPFGASGQQYYGNPLILLHSVDVDDNWFTYEGYIKGRQSEAEWNAGGGWSDLRKVGSGGSYPYDNEDWGGNRLDVTSRRSPSLSDALAGTSVLAFPTYSFRPQMTFNNPSGAVNVGAGGPGSFGRSQCDFFTIEALGSVIHRSGRYEDESSLLSTGGAHLQDGFYRQYFAYDLRSKQDLKDYYITVRDVVHPAGNKLFGTRQVDLIGANSEIVSSENSDSFLPPLIDSLSGWWKADTISPTNLQSATTTNGTHTSTNIVPPGFSSWAELPPAPFVSASLFAGDYVVKPNSLRVDTNSTTSASFPHRMFFNSANTNDEHLNSGNSYNGIISPNKSWLLSFYTKTTNNDIGLSGQNGQVSIFLGNTSSGNTVSNTYNVTTALSLPAHGANLYSVGWERISMKYDLSANPEQKFQLMFAWDNPNSNNYIDGVMLEEYKGSFTPSSYTHPSMNSSNVMSWYDSSINQLDVFANTSLVHGTQWAPPQYVANTGTGHPAVRFRSNTAWQDGHSTGNVYHYSSFPPDNNYTTGLTGRISPATNTVSRPIANQFTGFVVARTNLKANDPQYIDVAGVVENRLSFFQTGATSANALGGMTTGAYDLRILPQTSVFSNTGYLSTFASNSTGYGSLEYGAYAAPDYTGDGIRDLIDTTGVGAGLPEPGTNTSFGIFGISENAKIFTNYDLLTLHHNGRRWGNDSIFYASTENLAADLPSDLTSDRLDFDQQNAYNATFSFGYQQKENYQFANSVHSFFDGDIAEIVWYNRQLSNTQIALVEGYLAHKYGIQDDLIHKDGSGDHPYKYQAPPAIGANNTPY
jgi:hypothetical protein